MVGLSGVGLSTVANCILNRNPDLYYIKSHPFKTSDSASGCTLEFDIQTYNSIRVIDTIGFGDSSINQTDILKSLREALETVNFQTDAILYVIRNNLDAESYKLIKYLRNEFFRGRANQNFILICNNCKYGSLEKQRKNYKHVDDALKNFKDRVYEFWLPLEEADISQSNPVLSSYFWHILLRSYLLTSDLI